MKNAIFNPALLLTVLSLLACRENFTVIAGELNKQQQLEQSLQQWQLIKKAHNDNYQYSVSFSSWVGFSNRTTVTVLDDAVTKRAYEAFDQDGKRISKWQEESLEEIGIHKRGATPKTIDQLYSQCRTDVLNRSTLDHYIYLSFDKNNLLHQCTYVPKSCADDCSFGVEITDLGFIEGAK